VRRRPFWPCAHTPAAGQHLLAASIVLVVGFARSRRKYVPLLVYRQVAKKSNISPRRGTLRSNRGGNSMPLRRELALTSFASLLIPLTAAVWDSFSRFAATCSHAPYTFSIDTSRQTQRDSTTDAGNSVGASDALHQMGDWRLLPCASGDMLIRWSWAEIHRCIIGPWLAALEFVLSSCTAPEREDYGWNTIFQRRAVVTW